MIGAVRNWPTFLRTCRNNVQPGGWVELQDYYAKLQCIDRSLSGTALERWNDLFVEGAAKMGRNGRAAAHFKKWMREAGFVDVVERKFALPGNPWAKGRDEKQLGMMQMTNILDGLHGMSMTLFTKIHGMSEEDVEALLEDTRRDLRDPNIHFYFIV
jgi:Methyltransferase domain